jgi:hypothetical protein
VRRLCNSLVLGVLLAVCGGCGGSGAEDVLGETAGNLGKIRSGVLDIALLVEPRDGDPLGFELRGPFSLADDGGLPLLDVEYTQIANGERATVNLVAVDEKAYAVVDGQAYELPAEQASSLESASAAVSGRGGLDELALDDWIEDAQVSDGGSVGGSATDRVRGKIDVVAAANGLLELTRSFGRQMPAIEGDDAKQLEDAVRSTLFEVHTGKEDRLLRRLLLEADFGLEVPADLRSALGDLVGAKVRFRLAVDDPNTNIRVEAPESALPYSALGG